MNPPRKLIRRITRLCWLWLLLLAAARLLCAGARHRRSARRRARLTDVVTTRGPRVDDRPPRLPANV